MLGLLRLNVLYKALFYADDRWRGTSNSACSQSPGACLSLLPCHIKVGRRECDFRAPSVQAGATGAHCGARICLPHCDGWARNWLRHCGLVPPVGPENNGRCSELLSELAEEFHFYGDRGPMLELLQDRGRTERKQHSFNAGTRQAPA
jgi:hypothetical protein